MSMRENLISIKLNIMQRTVISTPNRTVGPFSAPFMLCFYNTTLDAFTLGLLMGVTSTESLSLWVWDANLGNPVREKAALTFGQDGNLVLADADGRIAWQTNTANKGVTGFKLLPNGNLVLHDSKVKFIWQSFDHPTNTMLVGQSLRLKGPTKLVSRASDGVKKNGAYSFVLEPERLALYYKSQNSPNPYLYYDWRDVYGPLEVKFYSEPETYEGYAYDINLEYQGTGSTGAVFLNRPKYNATLSFLRLWPDGNLRVHTFYQHVMWGAWEETFHSLLKRFNVGK
ncbi:hypothetical protein SLA2020_129200 [Shorea laevis]